MIDIETVRRVHQFEREKRIEMERKISEAIQMCKADYESATGNIVTDIDITIIEHRSRGAIDVSMLSSVKVSSVRAEA